MDYNSIDLYRRLGDIIVKKMDIEWMKGSMYNPQDRYKVFPCLNIKFHEESRDAYVKKLQAILETYKGKNEWCIFKYPFSRKGVHLISLIQYRDYCQFIFQQPDFISPQQYFGDDKYISLCDECISDLESLCDWVYAHM